MGARAIYSRHTICSNQEFPNNSLATHSMFRGFFLPAQVCHVTHVPRPRPVTRLLVSPPPSVVGEGVEVAAVRENVVRVGFSVALHRRHRSSSARARSLLVGEVVRIVVGGSAPENGKLTLSDEKRKHTQCLFLSSDQKLLQQKLCRR